MSSTMVEVQNTEPPHKLRKLLINIPSSYDVKRCHRLSCRWFESTKVRGKILSNDKVVISFLFCDMSFEKCKFSFTIIFHSEIQKLTKCSDWNRLKRSECAVFGVPNVHLKELFIFYQLENWLVRSSNSMK